MITNNEISLLTKKYASLFDIHYDSSFDNAVRSVVSTFPASHKEPQFVCVAGLPGCGKTVFCRTESKFKDFFVLDPDEYRCFHKSYVHIPAEELISRTNGIINIIGCTLLEIALKNRINVVICGTFVNREFWCSAFERHADCLKKYKKHMFIIAAPYEVCVESIEQRFIKESAIAGIVARKPDINFLNRHKQGFSSSMKKYIDSGFFDSFTLFSRTGTDADCVTVETRGEIVEIWQSITGE